MCGSSCYAVWVYRELREAADARDGARRVEFRAKSRAFLVCWAQNPGSSRNGGRRVSPCLWEAQGKPQVRRWWGFLAGPDDPFEVSMGLPPCQPMRKNDLVCVPKLTASAKVDPRHLLPNGGRWRGKGFHRSRLRQGGHRSSWKHRGEEVGNWAIVLAGACPACAGPRVKALEIEVRPGRTRATLWMAGLQRWTKSVFEFQRSGLGARRMRSGRFGETR